MLIMRLTLKSSNFNKFEIYSNKVHSFSNNVQKVGVKFVGMVLVSYANFVVPVSCTYKNLRLIVQVLFIIVNDKYGDYGK